MEGEVIHAELSCLSRYVIADRVSIGIVQDILKAELPDLSQAYEDTMDKVLGLARDLSDVVDLMLLPLLEQHESVITKREIGTLSVRCEYVTAPPKVDMPPENDSQKEEGT